MYNNNCLSFSLKYFLLRVSFFFVLFQKVFKEKRRRRGRGNVKNWLIFNQKKRKKEINKLLQQIGGVFLKGIYAIKV